MRILVIEDDPRIQRHYRNALGDLGVEYHLVDSRVEARSRLSAFSYDGIIVDLNLTDTASHSQGIEVLDYIDEIGQGALAIVVSATPNVRDVVNSYKKGAFEFHMKGDEDYYEIVEHFVTRVRAVKPDHFGKFGSLNTYLAFPEKTPFWEDPLQRTLGCGYEKMQKAVWGAFKAYLPVFRPRNVTKSFRLIEAEHSAGGQFWSKQIGSAIWISMHGPGGRHQLPLSSEAEAIAEISPVRQVEVAIWKLADSPRADYFDVIGETD